MVRKVLEKEARRFGLNLKNIAESDEFATLVKDYGVSKPDDLFAADIVIFGPILAAYLSRGFS